MSNSDKNRPPFFYNFIGPESDSIEYAAEFPVTELSLGRGSETVAKEANLIGAMDMPPPSPQERRRHIALMRRERHMARNAEIRSNLKRQMLDRDPSRFGPPPPTNPEFIRGSEMGPSPAPSRGKALSIGGNSGEQREMAADTNSKALMVIEEHNGGSSSSNPNPKSKKMKPCVEHNERVIFPKPMYYPPPPPRGSGSGPGSGEVIVKGYLNKGADERIRIICMCHNYPYTPEEFMKHAGGPQAGGGYEPPCYVTVSRGDDAGCVHARAG